VSNLLAKASRMVRGLPRRQALDTLQMFGVCDAFAGAAGNGSSFAEPQAIFFRDLHAAQSPGKSYTATDDFARDSESGVCAEWEAGFRLTGNRKPVMDGVSG
jgi:hypothetical protein